MLRTVAALALLSVSACAFERPVACRYAWDWDEARDRAGYVVFGQDTTDALRQTYAVVGHAPTVEDAQRLAADARRTCGGEG